MTVFKTFLKILNKNKIIILLYTAILLFFGIFNFQNNQNTTTFLEEKPDIAIINKDKGNKITENFIQYLEKYTTVKKIDSNLEDALFYREINYLITIPENYGQNFQNGLHPNIEIKSTQDYQASLANQIVTRYLKIASIYQNFNQQEDILLSNINNSLAKEAKINITSSLDTTSLEKIAAYYNFANYSIIAGCVYVISLILSSFNNQTIEKRILISKTSDKEINHYLRLSNSVFAFLLAFFYILISFILIGKPMISIHGFFYILNFLTFTFCILCIAFLIGKIVKNKEAINGIINVLALGSSFLCGSFVPIKYLPEEVVKIAHILPSYYFINNNEIMKTWETISKENLLPFLENILYLLIFSIIFIILTNKIKKKSIDR